MSIRLRPLEWWAERLVEEGPVTMHLVTKQQQRPRSMSFYDVTINGDEIVILFTKEWSENANA